MLSAQGYRKKTDAPQRKSNVYALSNVLKQAGGFDERETIDPRRDKNTVTYGTQTDPFPTVSQGITAQLGTEESLRDKNPKIRVDTIEDEYNKIGVTTIGQEDDDEEN